MRNDHLKQICQHPRIVERLPRHFQGLELPMEVQFDNIVPLVQHIIRNILAATSGRIFIHLYQDGSSNLYMAFEEPGDLIWVTLALPSLLPEKIL